MIKTKDIICRGQVLKLCNQRVIFWKERSILILSDLHIGKTAHFRKHGIPVPSRIMDKDLERLDAVIRYFTPKAIIIVGDLFHAEYNPDVGAFHSWIQKYQEIKWTLVMGNHDRQYYKMFENTGIKPIDNYMFIAPFTFKHAIDEEDAENQFYITGHTHPGVTLFGKGKQRVKLPCFQVSHNQLILPAFSLFTGLNTNQMPQDCKIYAFSDESIIEVN